MKMSLSRIEHAVKKVGTIDIDLGWGAHAFFLVFEVNIMMWCALVTEKRLPL